MDSNMTLIGIFYGYKQWPPLEQPTFDLHSVKQINVKALEIEKLTSHMNREIMLIPELWVSFSANSLSAW